ncbi:hypothetical protein B0A50_08817, partial [Salinomyces thailandicus]
MSFPVAIVTGASSGIGLALTHHLLTHSYHVILADLQPPPHPLPPNTHYIHTDIASWPSQAHLFAQTHALHNRLDVFIANAGIDDRDDIFHSLPPNTTHPHEPPPPPPKKPNTATFDTNLTGTYYGIKLAAYYMTLPKPSLVTSPTTTPTSPKTTGGKILLTSSAAALSPLPPLPQYTASKTALVALTHTLAPSALPHKIHINSVCPALVATNLAPPGLLSAFRAEQFTPMER